MSGNKINKTQIGYAKDLDVLMPIYNLLEYIDNYSKSSGSLWQYGNSKSFKCNNKTTRKNPPDDNKKNVEMAVQLKYLIRNLCEISKCL